MKHNGAEIIVRLLEKAGITIVSGIPGGANLPLYNALHKSKIRHILARHEQGSGFIAHGMARSTGKPAVCLATSGPGATNLVTAIADAKLDSVPIIAITGQVATSMIGTHAFQEVDTYGMTLPITKHNFLVRSARELLTVIPRAFTIATSGRPGPVLVDVPKDVQLEEIEFQNWPEPDQHRPSPAINRAIIARIAGLINRSRRPVIYGGGGIISSGCHEQIYALATRASMPVALTLMGLGSFPPLHPLYLGMLGMHAAPYTNRILDEADLLVVLGARFDDRAVGMAEKFCPHATIVHIDIDEAEIHKIRKADVSLNSDLGLAINELLPLLNDDPRQKWRDRVKNLKRQNPFLYEPKNREIHPVEAIKTIQSVAPADVIVCTDVGQHQMWVAQSFLFSKPRAFLTSGGLGTMGFGLPAAIGAALANPGRRVLCISGDGSLQMNIQELATLAELRLPVTVIVMNNGHLGLVRQQQELFYEENYIASKFGIDLNFAAIAHQFGIHGRRLGRPEDLAETMSKAVCLPGPSLVDVPVHYSENVFPMVPPGAPNTVMIGMTPSQIQTESEDVTEGMAG
jgi:acetolactate synthase-1/2/3 large subunit